MTISPAPAAAMTTHAAASVADDSSSGDEEMDPLSGESRAVSSIPYISLLLRAKVLEQAMEGLNTSRRNSLLSSSRRGGPADNNNNNNQASDPAKRMLRKGTKSFCMNFTLSTGDDGLDDLVNFTLSTGDDGLDDLVNSISSEGADRNTLILQAAVALWENHRKAAALRRWREILQVSTDSFQLTDAVDINNEARRILHNAETVHIATENAMAASAPVISPRAGSKSYDTVMAVKFARGDLDLLVVWARKLQVKTFPRGVDDTSVRETMKYLRFRQYQDGEALFFEGEIGEIFYFLFQGSVAVYVGSSKSQLKNVEGTRRTARIQEKPDLKQLGKRVFAYRTGEGFGETAMFTNDAIRTASAIAVGTCEVCELPKEIYKRTLKKYHQQFFEQAQKINFIQRVSLFKDWQRHRLSTVADVLEKRKLAFGDYLLAEGKTVLTSCFFVLSGLIKLTKHIDIAPPPFSEDTNQSTKKKPKHRIQMDIELQMLTVAEIVALEALTEPNKRVTYNAVAASANVELYVLKEVDARSFLGSLQSSLYQRVREMCVNEKSYRDARLNNVRHTFREQETLKRDTDLLRSQDDFAEVEQNEQSVVNALDAKADAALQGTNGGASSLICASAAPYLPHLRATNLMEFTKTPYIPRSPSSRVDHEALNAISSPKMLSTCAKNFIFENSNTLASDYPERLRLHFPPAPAINNRSLVEKVTSLMSPMSPPPSNLSTTTASPRHSARRRRPTTENREDQRVLDQQMKRLYDAKMHWDAGKKDFVLLSPSAVKNAAPSSTIGRAAAANVVRPTALHQELKSTQEAARKLVEDHLRKVSQRQSEAPGQTSFLHFF
ncbi:hypothetical protein Gpo141_00001372 [Globisporangium polare]